MRFSYSWLKDHLLTQATATEIADKFCAIGFEVEDLNDKSDQIKDIVVARIEAVEAHPNADKLRVCRVFDGKSILQIVCGAPNVYRGMKTALVHVGGFVPKSGVLKQINIRGIESQGMMCSYEELELDGDGIDGIIDIKTDVSPGDSLAKALGLDDPIFTVNVTPNRGDCFSVRGLARELSAANIGTLKPINYAQHFDEFDNVSLDALQRHTIPIHVETSHCRFFLGVVMNNVCNCFSPSWIQQRLKIAGQRPICALVDVTNFLAFDLGQPLHVYDCNNISGSVHVRQAKNGERLRLLNGQECTLSENDVVIADDTKPLTLAGIMGGEQSGTSLETNGVLLEAAYFDQVTTALTGQRYMLHSESRTRFERGVDPELTSVVMECMVSLIKKICGGTILGYTKTQSGDYSAERTVVTLNKQRLVSLSGNEFTDDAADILQKLCFTIVSEDNTQITVIVPSFRHDVSIEADLVEEVLRIRGYAHLPVQPLPLKHALAKKDSISEIKNVLCNRGMTEVYTIPFLNEEVVKIFADIDSAVEILKPLSTDMAFLQTSLVPAMLKTVEFNQKYSRYSGSIFEIESVFSKNENNTVCERKMICGVRFGSTERNWLMPKRDVDVFDVKADLLSVLSLYNIEYFDIKVNAIPLYYHPSKSGVICRGKEVLGSFGELHPLLLKRLELIGPIVLFEIPLEETLVAKRSRKIKPFDVSKFQPVVRDFSFVVDKSVPSSHIVSAVQKADPLIVAAKIFDVFELESTGNKKSIALEVKIQPINDTLVDAEIRVVHEKILDAVQNKCGGTLRD